MSAAAVNALAAPPTTPFISAVTAWEFADLQARSRLPPKIDLQRILDAYDIDVLQLPGDVWRLAGTLPDIHRDPVDRMLVAHAIRSGLTVVSADRTIRQYPVPTLW